MSTISPTSGLLHCKLLDGLPMDTVAAIEQACLWQEHETGEIVLCEDEELAGIYFIVAGSIRLFRRLGGERIVNIADFGAGESFGELSALDRGGQPAGAITTAPSVLAICPRDAFIAVAARSPELMMRMLQRLVQIIRAADRRIASLAGKTGAQRVYEELLRLAVPNPYRPGTFVVSPAPLHREIAGWAATTPDIVARAIAQLMKANLLDRQGRDLLLLDPQHIRALTRTDRSGVEEEA